MGVDTRATVHVVELLAEMVGFDTVNTAISGKKAPEAELSGFLEKRARAAGFDTRRFAVPGQCSNLLISYERNPASPWLLFDSHLDTVAVAGMSIDPFAAEIRDGRLWGRGACDTKGSGAAMFAALTEYAAEDIDGYNVMLLYSVDEEITMSGIRAFVHHHLPEIDRSIVGAVVGEPTRLEPVVAHNGVQRYLITTRGVAAHSANPGRGRSAISDMAGLILHLEEHYIPGLEATHPLTGAAQCSINIVRGGSAINIIPDSCEIEVDRRTVPGESPASIISEFKRHLDTYSESHTGVEIEFEASVETPPLTPRNDGVFLELITGALEQAGRSVEPLGVRYATHAGELCVAEVPAVVLGPGNIDQGHTKDEWIDLEELEAAVPIYRDIMRGGRSGDEASSGGTRG